MAASPLYVWGEPSVDNSATIDGLVPGSYYFLCSIAGHCDAGMKIKVVRLELLYTPPHVILPCFADCCPSR